MPIRLACAPCDRRPRVGEARAGRRVRRRARLVAGAAPRPRRQRVAPERGRVGDRRARREGALPGSRRPRPRVGHRRGQRAVRRAGPARRRDAAAHVHVRASSTRWPRAAARGADCADAACAPAADDVALAVDVLAHESWHLAGRDRRGGDRVPRAADARVDGRAARRDARAGPRARAGLPGDRLPAAAGALPERPTAPTAASSTAPRRSRLAVTAPATPSRGRDGQPAAQPRGALGARVVAVAQQPRVEPGERARSRPRGRSGGAPGRSASGRDRAPGRSATAAPARRCRRTSRSAVEQMPTATPARRPISAAIAASASGWPARRSSARSSHSPSSDVSSVRNPSSSVSSVASSRAMPPGVARGRDLEQRARELVEPEAHAARRAPAGTRPRPRAACRPVPGSRGRPARRSNAPVLVASRVSHSRGSVIGALTSGCQFRPKVSGFDARSLNGSDPNQRR